MNKASIIDVIPDGQWRDMHKFKVRFDDGNEGTAFSKTQQFRFQVGENVEYEINEKGSVRLNKAQYAGGGYQQPRQTYQASQAPVPPPKGHYTQQDLIIRQVALKAAVDYCKDSGCDVSAVVKHAEMFNAWIIGQPAGSPPQGHFDDDPF